MNRQIKACVAMATPAITRLVLLRRRKSMYQRALAQPAFWSFAPVLVEVGDETHELGTGHASFAHVTKNARVCTENQCVLCVCVRARIAKLV